MLSQKQTKLYWRNWSQVKKHLVANGFDTEYIAEERLELHKLAGVKPDKEGRCSMKALTNASFNTFLDLCQTMILGKPNQKRKSSTLIYTIKKLGLDDAYLDKISRDTWSVSPWTALNADQLTKLRFTATTRARQRKKQP